MKRANSAWHLFLYALFLTDAFFNPKHSHATANAETQPLTLRWAADAKSGAPFVYVDPENTNQMIGFEWDIMSAIANHMGRKLVFVQNSWEGLIPGLERGDYDVAANGIEVTPDREKVINFSIPYYATFEQIMVQKKNQDINTLKDLNHKKVGTLQSSLAHIILEKETQAKIVFYPDESNGYLDLERGRIDAFFMDYPIALYYAFSNPALKAVGEPIGHMTYGIAIAKKNGHLLQEINDALSEMKADGSLSKILDKWKLLHPYTIKQLDLSAAQSVGLSDAQKRIEKNYKHKISFSERIERYRNMMPLLMRGANLTLMISVSSMALAIILGLILVSMKLYGGLILQPIATVWIEAVRGTPLLIQLFLIYYGLPYLGIELSPFVAAVLGLGLNYATTEAENYRAGIQAVSRHQMDAAQALGLNPLQRFRYVILPQATRIILPPMTNDFIALLKDSSLVSVITMVELTTVYTQLASTYYDHLGLGLLIAALYFLLGYPFVRLAKHFEVKLKTKQRA